MQLFCVGLVRRTHDKRIRVVKSSQTVMDRLALLMPLAAFNFHVSNAFSQGTAFTYQGQLNQAASPANGSYDFTFTLYSIGSGGTAAAGPVTNSATSVSNGFFTTTIDFGADVFTGTNYWLEIGVQTNGAGAFTTLSPRQPMTPAPYSLYAPNAGTAANVSGYIALSHLPSALVTNGAGGVALAGAFNGNGGGLTNLNASQVSSGLMLTNPYAVNLHIFNGNTTGFIGMKNRPGTPLNGALQFVDAWGDTMYLGSNGIIARGDEITNAGGSQAAFQSDVALKLSTNGGTAWSSVLFNPSFMTCSNTQATVILTNDPSYNYDSSYSVNLEFTGASDTNTPQISFLGQAPYSGNPLYGQVLMNPAHDGTPADPSRGELEILSANNIMLGPNAYYQAGDQGHIQIGLNGVSAYAYFNLVSNINLMFGAGSLMTTYRQEFKSNTTIVEFDPGIASYPMSSNKVEGHFLLYHDTKQGSTASGAPVDINQTVRGIDMYMGTNAAHTFYTGVELFGRSDTTTNWLTVDTNAVTVSGGLTDTGALAVGATNSVTNRADTLEIYNGYALFDKGIGSYATNSTLSVGQGGITNTTPILYRVMGFTGLSVVQTNSRTGYGFSRGLVHYPTDIILQPGEYLQGVSCTAYGVGPL